MNPPQERRIFDVLPPREELSLLDSDAITPDFLLGDNQSQKAEEGRMAWNKNRRNGKLALVEACSDSRIILPPPSRIAVIRSITAAFPKDGFRDLIDADGMNVGVVMTHYDRRTVVPGKKPNGCGGLNARDAFENGDRKASTEEGIHKFVEQQIKTSDPTIQAARAASEMSEHTTNPILFLTQDTITGFPYLQGIFQEGKISTLAFPIQQLWNYDEQALYADGIPFLEEHVIPDYALEFLQSIRNRAQGYQRAYDSFTKRQEEQNPPLMIISTDHRPAALRYPSLDVPGQYFCITFPRKKDRIESTIQIPIEDLLVALDQTEYPITRFTNMRKILIETGDMNKSLEVAEALAGKTWMKPWLDMGNTIMIDQTQAGITLDIQELKAA